ncbi:MAG: heavy metal translocating P-type ATPase, partial [Gammaproteobacteria bacterium]
PLGEAVAAYDDPEIENRFSVATDQGLREAHLIIEGIHCGGCIAAIENGVGRAPGVREAQLNFANRRARVTWETDSTSLGAVVRKIEALGYSARPYDPQRQELALREERKRALRRIGLAGLLGMQVMMIGIALHAGGWSGMETSFERLFRWVSLALTLPVLIYSGAVFYAGAWRDLRNRSAGMDVPVALGLTLAFAGSVHATIGDGEHVYYDSVVMFVFLLLLARYLELVARSRNASNAEALTAPTPVLATRLTGKGADERQASVLASRLVAGDRILIKPGGSAPADAVVVEGRSSVDEALLSGESKPVPKSIGSTVLAGSTNFESPLIACVERVGADTVLSRIGEMAERARATKPALALLADRVAGWFVAVVLVIACMVAVTYWIYDPARWLPITISVLVVTCPCALSLATPVATTAALCALAREGIVVLSANALEALARVSRFVFDKTGTLTKGEFGLGDARPLASIALERCLAIAAALEAQSSHPLAAAFRRAAADIAPAHATGTRYEPGGGIVADVAGKTYALGSPAFVRSRLGPNEALAGLADDEDATIVILADDTAPLALFELSDSLRDDARDTIDALRRQGLALTVLSGDAQGPVDGVARALGIRDARARLTPAGKQSAIRDLQQRGDRAAMVGDGINDAPVLAAADVSLSMSQATQAAQINADIVLLHDNLAAIAQASSRARATLRVIRQNMLWAIAYNLVALPAAIAGLVPPWLAAIGMSASSLLVVGNSLRLARRPS